MASPHMASLVRNVTTFIESMEERVRKLREWEETSKEDLCELESISIDILEMLVALYKLVDRK